MKTTPIPVEFGRQGHSSNFYVGKSPTVPHVSTNALGHAAALVHMALYCSTALPSHFGLHVWVYVLNEGQVLGSRTCQTQLVLLPSQHSLHLAPIFRLLLKVAVKGMHQCDLSNFCRDSVPNKKERTIAQQKMTEPYVPEK